MKKKLFTALKLAISLGIIAYIFIYKVNFGEFWDVVKDAQMSLIALASVLFVSTTIMNMIRWHLILKAHDMNLGFFKVVRLFCIGMFFNTFMIGMNGGDFIKLYYLSKWTSQTVAAGTSIVLDRMAGLVGLTSMVFLALLFNYDDPNFSHLLGPVGLFVGLGIFGILFLIWTRKNPVFFNKIRSLMKHIKCAGIYDQISKAIQDYMQHPKMCVQVLLMSLAIHLSIVITNYWVGTALGIESMHFGQYCVIIPIILFLSAMPISVSGWGIGEALYISMFGLFGVPAVQAVSISLLLRFLYILIGLASSIAYIAPGLHDKPGDKT